MKTDLHRIMNHLPVGLLVCSALTVSATGFRLPDQDAFATARGEAFVATADNPSAIYYNPAGITQLEGQDLRGGIYGIYLAPSYESSTGATYDNKDPWHAAPQIFYTYNNPGVEPFSFGLGVYSPYGLGLEWPQDTGFRTLATKASLTYITINPVVAMKMGSKFSFGGGLTINYACADLRQGLAWPTQPYDEFRFSGGGWDLGYNLGMLWKPHEKLSIGVAFHSDTTVDLEGNIDAHNNVVLPSPPAPMTIPAFTHSSSAHADFPFPLNAVFGISYRPTKDWNFEFDADYTDWSRLGTVNFQQATGLPPLLPQTIPVTLNWEPSWYYEFGATRYLGNGWSVSGGYIFNENSVPDANYTPLVADLDRHFFSIGAGFKGKRFSFDAAYQFGYGPTRTVSGSAYSNAGQNADGRYEFTSQALLVTCGYHF